MKKKFSKILGIGLSMALVTRAIDRPMPKIFESFLFIDLKGPPYLDMNICPINTKTTEYIILLFHTYEGQKISDPNLSFINSFPLRVLFTASPPFFIHTIV